MGIAYHASHIVWFEVGRSELCRAAGVPYSEMEREGFFFVVTEVSCRYLKPAYYDQEIVVRTWLKEVNRRAARFEYQLVSVDGATVIAQGQSRHLVLDRAGQRKSMPDRWIEALRRVGADASESRPGPS